VPWLGHTIHPQTAAAAKKAAPTDKKLALRHRDLFLPTGPRAEVSQQQQAQRNAYAAHSMLAMQAAASGPSQDGHIQKVTRLE
jgi:hypothetical protein